MPVTDIYFIVCYAITVIFFLITLCLVSHDIIKIQRDINRLNEHINSLRAFREFLLYTLPYQPRPGAPAA